MKTEPTDWGQPFRGPEPDQPASRIWRLCLSDLSGDPMETLQSLTTRSEHRRALSYRFDVDGHRHLAGRGLVRTFLAHQYDCAPQDPSITESPQGKPQLNGTQGCDAALKFNIAHTRDVVVAAFSHTHPIGIDVEAQSRDADMVALAQRIFTESERRRWNALPPVRRSEFFFHVWTCKEAFLKAIGHGLQRALHTVECTFDGDTVVGLEDASAYDPPSPQISAARWALRPFSGADDVLGAVVRTHSLPSPILRADATHYVNQIARSRKT